MARAIPRDVSFSRARLPAVKLWLAWNEPNNPTFLTPQYAKVGGKWVRPHDLEVRLEPNGSTVPAVVERVVSLGFEVRVLLRLDGDESATVQLTRAEAQELELAAGTGQHGGETVPVLAHACRHSTEGLVEGAKLVRRADGDADRLGRAEPVRRADDRSFPEQALVERA